MATKKSVPATKLTKKKKTSSKVKVVKKSTVIGKSKTTKRSAQADSHDLCPIVGIGASAGRLEVFELFLKRAPTDFSIAVC